MTIEELLKILGQSFASAKSSLDEMSASDWQMEQIEECQEVLPSKEDLYSYRIDFKGGLAGACVLQVEAAEARKMAANALETTVDGVSRAEAQDFVRECLNILANHHIGAMANLKGAKVSFGTPKALGKVGTPQQALKISYQRKTDRCIFWFFILFSQPPQENP